MCDVHCHPGCRGSCHHEGVTLPSTPSESSPERPWTTDVLPDDWVARTIALAEDDEGTPVATLVHRQDAGLARRRGAVLYLHGFVDYFFQAAHADRWREHGYDFYALDLRKYGRSLRSGQTPNWITDLTTYDEEITAALEIIRTEHDHARIVLLGHSTGGLIAALYAADHPGSVSALVLNSPWFDLNASWFNRVIATRVIDLLGPAFPHVRVATLGEAYGRSLHTSTGGAWDYDLAWKPLAGFPIKAGWLRAIRDGHARLHRGLHIGVPVLVCTSGRSGHPRHPSPEDLMSADCVLDVAHMAARAPALGNDVTVQRVPGGRHDLALSDQPAREQYERTVFGWLERRLP